MSEFSEIGLDQEAIVLGESDEIPEIKPEPPPSEEEVISEIYQVPADVMELSLEYPHLSRDALIQLFETLQRNPSPNEEALRAQINDFIQTHEISGEALTAFQNTVQSVLNPDNQ